MKIIDNKGRVFGLVNLIDLLVLIFILAMLPMFKIAWRLYNSKPQPPQIEVDLKRYQELQSYERETKGQIKDFLKGHKRYKRYFNTVK
jgi:hypothetical protein